MKIGMVVAIQSELQALIAKLGIPSWLEKKGGFEVRMFRIEGHDVYVVQSGAGEIRAAAATQLLILGYGVELIANFGVCGGLLEYMQVKKPAVVSAVVHYDFDTSAVDDCAPGKYEDHVDVYIPTTTELVDAALETEPELVLAVCASGDKFLNDPDIKYGLHKRYGAAICDMESAGILLTANRNKIPTLLIKVVSDSITGGAKEYGYSVHDAASDCVDVMLNVIKSQAFNTKTKGGETQ